MRSLSIALVISLTTAAAAIAAPVIRVEPLHIDFGDMKQNEAKQATLTIANEGDAPLNIRNVETTCGCTVAELAKDTLGPGESTTIAVDFNSKSFQGPQTKFINIFSDDPKLGDVDVMITADVKVPLYNDPPGRSLGFEVTKSGNTSTKEWTFWTEDVPALKMSVKDKPDFVDVDIKNGVDGDKQRSKVNFTLRADTPPGRKRTTLILGTNLADEPTVTLEVGAMVIQDLILGRDRVNFNYVQAGQPLRSQIRVGAYDKGTHFNLTGAEIDIPGLKASVKNSIPGTEWQAVIEGNALPEDDATLQANHGRMKGELTIHTDLPSSPVLTVHVSYMVRL